MKGETYHHDLALWQSWIVFIPSWTINTTTNWVEASIKEQQQYSGVVVASFASFVSQPTTPIIDSTIGIDSSNNKITIRISSSNNTINNSTHYPPRLLTINCGNHNQVTTNCFLPESIANTLHYIPGTLEGRIVCLRSHGHWGHITKKAKTYWEWRSEHRWE